MDAVDAADVGDDAAEQVHLVIAGEQPRVDDERGAIRRAQVLGDIRQAAFDQDLEVLPIGGIVGRGRVGFQNDTPIRAGGSGLAFHQVDEEPVEIADVDVEAALQLDAGLFLCPLRDGKRGWLRPRSVSRAARVATDAIWVRLGSSKVDPRAVRTAAISSLWVSTPACAPRIGQHVDAAVARVVSS